DVRDGKAELGVAAISITSAREEEFEFSQPIMNAGLQILVAGKGRDAETHPLTDLMRLLFSATTLAWLGLAMLLVLIPAHLVFFLERNHKQGIIPTRSYFPGIFFALYWAAGTLATQADHAPRHWISRVIALLWMFVGIVFVALYTAQLTANLTVQQIAGEINGPRDLPGKQVATTRGSTAAAAVRELGANVHEVTAIADAYKLLTDKKVDAVVFDAPVLLYYAANEGKGRVQTVGAPFRKEDYGIIFPQGHRLRPKVNVVLLALREEGTYQRLYDKWFATRQGP
ncbi:MAG: transporter substrate-binding domain-containing protein, partial [Hyphomicrobiaceae bacterium]